MGGGAPGGNDGRPGGFDVAVGVGASCADGDVALVVGAPCASAVADGSGCVCTASVGAPGAGT